MMTLIRRAMSELRMEVASASAVDLPFLIWLHQTVMRPYVEPIWGWDPHIQEDFVKSELARGKTSCISSAGNRLGMIEVNVNHDCWEVRNIRIAPDAQGRGLGTMLLTAVMRASFDDGKPVSLRVFRTNLRAISLYQKLGFSEREHNIRMSTSSSLLK
jgi:ribosomal protein S18 acetylase RimI-like enzyme